VTTQLDASADSTTPATGKPNIQQLLGAMPRLDASDLHIKVGIPPTYRIGGRLKPINAEPLGAEEADDLIDPILTPKQREDFRAGGNLDFAWHIDEGPNKGERFRVNLFRSGGHTHAAFRRVKAQIPSYADLHLPPVYSTLVERANEGLVLVVGITGSGKSSTLAAMLDQVNATRAVNIITIEDPVEYRFTPKKSIISQREIGIDVKDFQTALRYVVRQDPDVVFIGEMRDKETVLAAIQAAETGHLVFATLHTADTMQAFGRILEFFPESERGFVRHALANSLKAICAQKLIPAVDGFETKVVPATEVLLASPSVRDKIREGEEEDLPAIVNSSEGEGMHSFTRSLYNLITKDWVDMQTAKQFAPNREALDSIVKGVSVKAQSLVNRVKGPR
jgi:twitching motility protein PilT